MQLNQGHSAGPVRELWWFSSCFAGHSKFNSAVNFLSLFMETYSLRKHFYRKQVVMAFFQIKVYGSS